MRESYLVPCTRSGSPACPLDASRAPSTVAKMSPDDDVVVVVGQYHPWLRTAAETGSRAAPGKSGLHARCPDDSSFRNPYLSTNTILSAEISSKTQCQYLFFLRVQAPPGSQASSRGEAKDSALPSSPDRYLLEPTERPKESQASRGVWREDSVLLSMPGRKQVPHRVMTGAYRGFSRATVPEWGFRRGTTSCREKEALLPLEEQAARVCET